MDYDGHPNHNLTTCILLIIWPFVPDSTVDAEDKYCCRTLSTARAEYAWRKEQIHQSELN